VVVGASLSGKSQMASLSNMTDKREEILRIAAKHGAKNLRLFGAEQ